MANKTKDPEKAMEVVDNNDHESEEEVDDDEAATGENGTDAGDSVSSQLLKNPAVMAALQGKLDSMVGSPSGYIQVSLYHLSVLLSVFK